MNFGLYIKPPAQTQTQAQADLLIRYVILTTLSGAKRQATEYKITILI